MRLRADMRQLARVQVLLVHVFKKASRCMKPYATGVASHLDSWHSRYVRELNSTLRSSDVSGYDPRLTNSRSRDLCTCLSESRSREIALGTRRSRPRAGQHLSVEFSSRT